MLVAVLRVTRAGSFAVREFGERVVYSSRVRRAGRFTVRELGGMAVFAVRELGGMAVYSVAS